MIPVLAPSRARTMLLLGSWVCCLCACTHRLAPQAPAASVPMAAAAPATAPAPGGLSLPIEYYRLANGLQVVLARDSSVPTVTVSVNFHIGWRLEPKGRTGFAHLFEHLMFEETQNLAKGEADKIIAGNGGISNGQTHPDYTNYFEVVPSHALEPVLWTEADRLRGLVLSAASLKNQQDVVKNEVRVNVLNRPYGAFGWLDLPQYANQNWHNAHNFYGELDEIDAATLTDVRSFYDQYYVPRNAVLVVAGDFDPAAVRVWVDRYFAPLPDRGEPHRPDTSEPRQVTERRVSRTDPLAPRPGVAIGYHVPERGTRDWYAFLVLNEVLAQGEDSRLWRRLVADKGYADSIDGGINIAGSAFDYDGPTLWTLTMVHDEAVSDEAIVSELDAAIADLDVTPVSPAELARALTKIRSGLYDLAGSPTRFGLATLLASFALFDDDPSRLNRIEAELAAVTPQELAAVAHEYLRAGNRTVLSLTAGAGKGVRR